jgi:uncharacterized peroxidase-related enzyme
MSTVKPINPAKLTGTTAALVEETRQELGFVPDLMCMLSHSPAALRGYLGLRASLKGCSLPTSLRERIAIAVAGVNGCNSCLVNHRHMARGAGVAASEIDAAARFASDDHVVAVVLRFAEAIIGSRGHVDEATFAAIRKAGFGDAAIVEIAAVIGANMLANFVNNLAHATIPR